MTRIHRIFAIPSTVVLGAVVAACSLIEETLPGVTLSDSNVLSVLHSLDKNEIDAARLAPTGGRHRARPVVPKARARYAGERVRGLRR